MSETRGFEYLDSDEQQSQEPADVAPVIVTEFVASVTCGDLANARYPVAVGHFESDGIVSAERVLDFYLEGKLARRHKLGSYAGPIGSSMIVLEEDERPPGAVVIGLGTPFRITPADLLTTFFQAVVALGVQLNEAPGKTETGVCGGISTILIGTVNGGLTARTSMKTIMEAMRQANVRLSRNGLRPLGHLEFIELYEDRAISAMHTLKDLVAGEYSDCSRLEDEHGHVRGTGGGQLPGLNRREDDWWDTRVHVRGLSEDGKPTDRLVFTVSGDRAQAAEDTVGNPQSTAGGLIEDAVGKPEWDPKLSKALFHYLIPPSFKTQTEEGRNLCFVVDEASAAFPWEILHQSGKIDEAPMVARAGFLRQLVADSSRPLGEATPERTALVIGDPDLQGKGRLGQLAGAREEAEIVLELLKGAGYETAASIGEPAESGLLEFVSDSYQIVHLAGHGVFEYKTESGEVVTGMAIGGDSFLTPEMIRQMPDTPEFVFANCCHLGEVSADAERETRNRTGHRLAANLGTQFIRMGVKAVVVAGWAVKDFPAKLFAETLYKSMLDGTAFGEAVFAARKATFEKYPKWNTWGAYQCYGDPYYTMGRDVGRKAERNRVYVSPSEAILELTNFCRAAATGATRDAAVLNADLGSIRKAIDNASEKNEAWMSDPGLIEALAEAYYTVDDLGEAVELYERVVETIQIGHSFEAVTRLYRTKARLAVEYARSGDAGKVEQAAEMTRDAVDRLEKLLVVARSDHAIKEIASALKSRAQTLKLLGESPDAALRKASDYYMESFFKKLEADGRVDHFPLINWLVLDRLHTLVSPEGEGTELHPEAARYLKEVRDGVLKDADENPSFWDLMVDVDIATLVVLSNDESLTTSFADVMTRNLDELKSAWKRGGSYQARRSIVEHLKCLTTIVSPDEDKQATESASLRARLHDELIDMLEEIELIMED